MRELKMGDIVNRGDVLLTSPDGIVQLTLEPEGGLKLPVDLPPEPPPLPLEPPAVVLLGGNGGDLQPGLRVDRVAESVTPASLGFSADTGAVTPEIAVTRPQLINRAPQANPDVNAVAENTPASGNLLSNDTDPENNPLTVIGFSIVTNGGSTPTTFAPGQSATIIAANGTPVGTLVVNPDGSYVFTPATNYHGPVPVATYTIDDGHGGTASSTLTLGIVTGNLAPTANPDTNTFNENTPANGNVLFNDTDPEKDPLTVSGFAIVTNGSGTPTTFAPGQTATITDAGGNPVGTLVINPDGSYVFTPSTNYTGPVPVATYTIDDGHGGTGSATLSLTPGTGNLPPTANTDVNTVAENTPASGNLLSNDTDPENNPLTVTGFSIVTNGGSTPTTFAPGQAATITAANGTLVGTLVVNPDGSYVFTPATNYHGPVPVATYTIDDGHGGTASSTLTLGIVTGNLPPTANPDVNAVAENTPASGNLLSNDTDPERDPLTVTGFAIDTNGSGTPTTFVPGQSATIIAANGTPVGTLVVNPDGSYVFTPATNYHGPVPVATYTIDDGHGGTASSTLTLGIVTGNLPPTANPDVNAVAENTPASGNLLSNDTDPERDPLTVTGFAIDTNGSGTPTTFVPGQSATIIAANGTPVGTLVVNPDGSYVFTPATNYHGPVPVATYTIDDGHGGTASSTLTLGIVTGNLPPTANPDVNTVAENTPASGNLLSNDTDPERDPLTVTGFAIDTNGSGTPTTFVPGQSATIIAANGTPVGTLVVNPDGSYVFTPATNYHGPVPVATYTIDDGHGGTSSSTLTLGIVTGNLPPTANPDVNTVAENTPASGNLLSNDTDPEKDPLTVTGFAIDTNGSGTPTTFAPGRAATITAANGTPVGTLVVNPDGSYVFTPATNYHGPVPVATYTIDDGHGGTASSTLTLGIVTGNLPPTANPDVNTVAENTPASGNLLSNDTDPERDPLTVTGFAIVTNGGSTPTTFAPGQAATITAANGTPVGTLVVNPDGSYVFTPATNYHGPVPVATYTIDDGHGGTASSTLTLGIVTGNLPPTANPDVNTVAENTPASGNLLSNDTDPERDPLTVTGFAIVTNGGSTPTTFAPGQAATITAANGTPVGTLVVNPDGSYVFTPATNYHGPVPVATYTIDDGHGGTSSSTLTLGIVTGNLPPTANPDVNAYGLNTPAAGNVLTNDTDPERDPLTVTGFSVVTHGGGAPTAFAPGQAATLTDAGGNPVGTLTLGANGDYVFVPATNYTGPVPVLTYTIDDGHGGTASTTLTINSGVGNLPPTANPDVNAVAQDATVSTMVATGVLDNDTDLNHGDVLVVTGVAAGSDAPSSGNLGSAIAGALGHLTLNADGSYSYVADNAKSLGAGATATDTFTYAISDGHGGTASTTLTITVTGVNDAPTARDDLAFVTDQQLTTAGNVLLNDTDPDAGDVLTVKTFQVDINGDGVAETFAAGTSTVLSNAAGAPIGTLAVNADGSYSFTRAPDYTGTIPKIVYAVDDGHGGTASATLGINDLHLALQPKAYDVSTNLEEEAVGPAGYGFFAVGTLNGGVWHTDNSNPNEGTGTVEVGNSATYGVTTAAGGTSNVIELEQDYNDRSNLYTTMPTVAGEVYKLDFDFAARQPTGVNPVDHSKDSVVYVYWEGQLVDTLTQTSGVLTHYTLNLVASQTGIGQLEFIAQDSNSFGGVFDNINLALQQNTGVQGYRVNLPGVNDILSDVTGTETLHTLVSGVPAGWTVTDGGTHTAQANGDVDVTGWNLSTLALLPATDATSVALTVTAQAQDPSGHVLASTSQQVALTLDASDGNNLYGSAGSDNLIGGNGNQTIWGLDGDDRITSGTGNVTLLGGSGNDILNASASASALLDGGTGDDILIGGAGNDVLSGGRGNDTMTGGGGVDVFKWHLGDGGTAGAGHAADVITDFDAAPVANGGDALDLRDLLVGELKGPNGTAGNLDQYLNIETSGSQTVIHVSTTGQFDGSNTSAVEDQTITLTNVNLRSFYNDVGATNQQLIADLLNRGKLITDGH